MVSMSQTNDDSCINFSCQQVINKLATYAPDEPPQRNRCAVCHSEIKHTLKLLYVITKSTKST